MTKPMQRGIQYLFTLSRFGYNGARPVEIQQAMNLPNAPTVTRDLQVLTDEGVVEVVAGREAYFRLSPRLIQLAVAHQSDSATQFQRIDEYTQRCKAGTR